MSVTFQVELKNLEKGYYEQVPGTPELNVCNGNASLMLAALGLDLEPGYCGSLPANEFRERLECFLRACEQGRGSEFTRTTTDEGGETSARVISIGLDIAGLSDRLHRLSDIAVAADALDAEIGWA